MSRESSLGHGKKGGFRKGPESAFKLANALGWALSGSNASLSQSQSLSEMPTVKKKATTKKKAVKKKEEDLPAGETSDR